MMKHVGLGGFQVLSYVVAETGQGRKTALDVVAVQDEGLAEIIPVYEDMENYAISESLRLCNDAWIQYEVTGTRIYPVTMKEHKILASLGRPGPGLKKIRCRIQGAGGEIRKGWLYLKGC